MQPNTASTNDVLNALRAAKESVRLQLHLFSMDAKARWREIENKLEGWENRLNSGEPAPESLIDEAAGSVRELTQVVKDLVRESVARSMELSAPVSTLVSGPAHTCAPTDSLAQAAKLLWENDCGALLVTNGAGVVVGVITDRDICMAGFTRGLPLHALNVASTMSETVHSINADETISQLAALMSHHQIRRVPVLDHGHLIGVVSLADLATSLHETGSAGLARASLVCRTLAAVAASRPRTQHARAAE
jgi:CBS domain-containing protein